MPDVDKAPQRVRVLDGLSHDLVAPSRVTRRLSRKAYKQTKAEHDAASERGTRDKVLLGDFSTATALLPAPNLRVIGRAGLDGGHGDTQPLDKETGGAKCFAAVSQASWGIPAVAGGNSRKKRNPEKRERHAHGTG